MIKNNLYFVNIINKIVNNKKISNKIFNSKEIMPKKNWKFTNKTNRKLKMTYRLDSWIARYYIILTKI
jgi:hypothetical protein